MNNKPIVFVITPFGTDFIALYDELKKTYEREFEFTNGGDLDNQQNILQDIVEGIYRADVIIADLTGLNPNVFYELGLAHAMNKKVIIITQDISELPFDIKSYRANEYSLQFNKLPKFKEELTKLLKGAIDNSVHYGNPVVDYIPTLERSITWNNNHHDKNTGNNDTRLVVEENDVEGEKGAVDYIVDIEDHSKLMTTEISLLGEELSEMNDSIIATSNEINRVKENSGNVDAAFTKKVCRKLSGPVDEFANKLKTRVENITLHWSIVENSYLSLLDSPYIQTEDNIQSLNDSIDTLEEMQSAIDESDTKVEKLVEVLRSSMGIERHLNRAMASLIKQLENYLSMTETMMSSIDRIIAKSTIVKKNMIQSGESK